MRLVAEVNASFQELTHVECWHGHVRDVLFPVDPPRALRRKASF